MSFINDALQRAERFQKANNGTGFVWLVVCGGIVSIGLLLSSNSRNGAARPDQAVPVLARKAPEPRPASAPAAAGNEMPIPSSQGAVSKPALRLQAVFFSAKRPAAMINGRTVLLNDSVEEFHVTAITTNSVTLVSRTGTKVLTLAQ